MCACINIYIHVYIICRLYCAVISHDIILLAAVAPYSVVVTDEFEFSLDEIIVDTFVLCGTVIPHELNAIIILDLVCQPHIYTAHRYLYVYQAQKAALHIFELVVNIITNKSESQLRKIGISFSLLITWHTWSSVLHSCYSSPYIHMYIIYRNRHMLSFDLSIPIWYSVCLCICMWACLVTGIYLPKHIVYICVKIFHRFRMLTTNIYCNRIHLFWAYFGSPC